MMPIGSLVAFPSWVTIITYFDSYHSVNSNITILIAQYKLQYQLYNVKIKK